MQVIVDADTRLVIAAARPMPGTTADAHVWRASGLAKHCQDVTVLGDGDYLNCGMVVPHRKRPAGPCSRARRTTTRPTARSGPE
ncbi:transposase family protein [Streptomyces sp. NPDC001858]